MELTKYFRRTIFPVKVIVEVLEAVEELAAAEQAKQREEYESATVSGVLVVPYFSQPGGFSTLSVSKGNEAWRFDDVDEWYGAYERGVSNDSMYYSFGSYTFSLSLDMNLMSTVSFRARTNGEAERLMRFFNLAEAEARVPVPFAEPPAQPPVVVFIGHGRSGDWREIKDHLQDSHHYKIEAYEVGARAGHSIRDVLTGMLTASSFALLLMTGEDETADGDARARQNVVHETGLFQGRLGFNRAIAVVEHGVEMFSNLDGVQQIRYEKGSVKSTFGEILATLRREFGDRR